MAKSRDARLRELERRLIADAYVDALLVVESHEGEELFRCGGRWSKNQRRYVDAPDCKPHRVRLKESQYEAALGFRAWLEASRRGDKTRPIVLMLAGDRGSGKTWFLAGVGLIAIGLEWPNEYQFVVNLTTPQRRECVESMREVARPEWIAFHSDDLRDPYSLLITGSHIGWLSSRNPKRLRQAKLNIRHVLINEGQDQPEVVYTNAVGATRNRDGLTTIATNRPQSEAGDWVAAVADAIDAEELPGIWYLLDAKKNDAVDPTALDKRARAIRAVSREAADADTGGGGMRLAGPIAYPGFKPFPWHKGGHVGDPPAIGWRDVTREVTAAEVEDSAGWPYVIGVDFQRRPGIVGNVAKFFRDETGKLVLVVLAQVCTEGEETAFSDSLFRRGYTPNPHDSTGALIVGDATGARQNARHRWEEPTSFRALADDGWLCLPPEYTKRRKPSNPLVRESIPQVHAAFVERQIMISTALKEPESGFAALVESLRRAKKTPRGALIEKGGWQHGPDGLRYLAWRFLPRVRPPLSPQGIDDQTFDEIARIKVLGNG